MLALTPAMPTRAQAERRYAPELSRPGGGGGGGGGVAHRVHKELADELASQVHCVLVGQVAYKHAAGLALRAARHARLEPVHRLRGDTA